MKVLIKCLEKAWIRIPVSFILYISLSGLGAMMGPAGAIVMLIALVFLHTTMSATGITHLSMEKTSVKKVCSHCGEEEPCCVIKVKYYMYNIIELFIPFIKIRTPYKERYFIACDKCYTAEANDKGDDAILLLLETGIIENQEVNKEQYQAMIRK